MKLHWITLVTGLAAAIGVAHAQSGGMKDMDMKMDKKAAGKVHKASGKVTKVNQAKGTVTIAHGPVASMSWPSMTMSFKAKDKAMLQKVKPGDQVEFSFVQSGKDHTITAIK
jgi:Cu(I)/Ag(I) efflux system protein CusF